MANNPTIDKIAYMMDRMGGDDELTPDDMENMIVKVFVASFEYEHGFEAELIKALVDARYMLLCHAGTSDDDNPSTLSAKEAEQWYLACQKKMYMETGANEAYAEESSSWPDTLPLHADWDKEFLRTLARKEVAHHLVVMDQIRAEMAKRNNTETT